ncbi:MAG: GNAT family N-acetyltransferase [Firmicutes bacterium]|nr:GNAT family N-acetyltransferase [Bacillota bacterium]
MSIQIFEVSNRRELDIFVRMPGVVYYNDPLWLPPPPHQVVNKLMKIPPENLHLLVAVENNNVVGRIAGMINKQHFENDTALFGFFESIDNKTIAKELLNTVERWAASKNYHRLNGPVSYNTNDSIGMLVEGFDLPPQDSMPYNPYYYSSLLESAGYSKYEDLLAYMWNDRIPVPEKLVRVSKKARANKGLAIRQLNLSNIQKEAQVLSTIHNETMQDNWGAERLPIADAANYLRNYRSYADPNLLMVAEVNKEPAGIMLCLPNTLNPQHKSCRVAVMAVRPKYRSKGIAALLMHETILRLFHKGYNQAEISLVMENNTMMNRILQKVFNFDIAKRFRLYQKKL